MNSIIEKFLGELGPQLSKAKAAQMQEICTKMIIRLEDSKNSCGDSDYHFAMESKIADWKEFYALISSYQEVICALPFISQEEIDLMQDGKYIQAIKRMREKFSMGLKEAKDMVDSYRTIHPNLPNPSPRFIEP